MLKLSVVPNVVTGSPARIIVETSWKPKQRLGIKIVAIVLLLAMFGITLIATVLAMILDLFGVI